MHLCHLLQYSHNAVFHLGWFLESYHSMNWKFWKRRSRKDLEESVSILTAALATATVKAETLETENGKLSEDLHGSRGAVSSLVEDVRHLHASIRHCESKIDEQARELAREKLETELAKAELAERLRLALGQLDDDERDLIVWRHFEQLSARETAQLLQITEAAASKRYIRVLERLRTILIDLGVSQPGK